MTQMTNDIQQLLSEGQTETAIEKLLAATESARVHHDQAVLISARYEEFRTAQRLGMSDGDTERNKINAAILDLANDISYPVTTKPTSSFGNMVLPLSLAGLFLIGLIIYFLIGKTKPNTDSQLKSGGVSVQQPQHNTNTNSVSTSTSPTTISLPATTNSPFKNVDMAQKEWYSPGQKLKMSVRELVAEVKDPSNTLLKIKLAIRCDTYAASISNDEFLIEIDGDASKSEAYINASIDRGETKKFDLVFTVPNTAKTVKFIHQFDDIDKNVVIPVTFSR